MVNSRQPSSAQTVVIGAGPAGLSVAAMLRQAGVPVVVVDRSDAVASSWRSRYDRLHLHTVRSLSHLPGYGIPRSFGRWVARDDVVRYLESYTRHHRLEIQFGTEVQRIDRAEDHWCVRTTTGDIEAGSVVVALGDNQTPLLPDWPGRETFTGELIHASQYRNPSKYRGHDVLVVGCGNTGAEIALDLLEGGAAKVRVAVRTPPHVILRSTWGVPAQVLGVLVRYFPARAVDTTARLIRRVSIGDLTRYGLGEPDDGFYTRIKRKSEIPLIDVGLLPRLRNGEVTTVPAVTGFAGAEVILADGQRISPDRVIAATGYRRSLEPLVGHLGVLQPNGRPVSRGPGNPPVAPGLWFAGYVVPISGMFRELAIEARRISKQIARRSGSA
jgi:putative flavoprotein involved in K+ transport